MSDPLSYYGKGLGLPIFCIGTIFFVLRGISRFLTRTFYPVEDSLFYIASLLSWITWIGNWTSWGNDDTDVRNGDQLSLNSAGQVQVVATEVLSVTTIVIWKFYLLVMYCRFFEPAPSRRVLLAVGSIVVLHAAVGIIGSLAQCVPISMLGKFIGNGQPNPQCASGHGYGFILYGPDLASAVAVLILPLVYLRNKHWTILRRVALGWMMTAGLAIIIFTILGWVNTDARYESDPWWAATALSPFWVSFLYMLIGCYGELHPLWSSEARRRMRDDYTAPSYPLGGVPSSPQYITIGRPYISAPIEATQARDLPSRQSTVSERVPKYIV